ncbi:MAG: hypothetical protein JWL83_1648 [Actinomycetia bacterium]|nr:hypothetical protein [Actinomycetes bacterium]
MATDLAPTPTSGLMVQACGDAHISNFGVYASPERQLVFDVNDFDETMSGPWEWDVKRLAASVMVAARQREFDERTCREITRASVGGYRRMMQRSAEKRTLDAWYGVLSDDELRWIDDATKRKRTRRQVGHLAAKARSRDSLRALAKLADADDVDGDFQIRSDPPLLLPLRDLSPGHDAAELEAAVLGPFESYKETLGHDRRHILERFRPVDVALKVVGVGSVGTRCLVMLLLGRDRDDPLFLQFKEAGNSVLSEHLPGRGPRHQGRRVVEGQRLMQTTSDIFLGWFSDRDGRHYYGRQLQDWKASFEVDVAEPDALNKYVTLCGWALARAHARSGDAIAIGAYLGTSDAFDRAITAFAEVYAAQNDADYAAFTHAIATGQLATDAATPNEADDAATRA